MASLRLGVGKLRKTPLRIEIRATIPRGLGRSSGK
jgi:hypothetical protein